MSGLLCRDAQPHVGGLFAGVQSIMRISSGRVQRSTAAGKRMVGPPSLVADQRCDLPAAPAKALARSSLVALFVVIFPILIVAQAHQTTAAHVDPVTPVVLALAIILAAAKLGGHFAGRVGQPAVLGELVVAVALGSLDLVGIGWFQGIET